MHENQHAKEHRHYGGLAHDHAPKSFGMAFAVGTALNLSLVVAELVFGTLSNSLALISDGMHNLSDVLGLLLAWGAAWLAMRRPTATRTYGYRRASILAALANAALLFVATGAIIIEAVRRFTEIQAVESGTVMWVAGVGIIINTATALLFFRGREHDLNISGAFLHMAADAAVSLGVVISALIITWTGWHWVDPAVSIAVATVILWSSWRLTREALNLALDAVPAGIDQQAVEGYLRGLPGVTEVHDLHIWAMSTTETALTAQLIRSEGGETDNFLNEASHELEDRFHIQHTTLQIETGKQDCPLAPMHVV